MPARKKRTTTPNLPAPRAKPASSPTIKRGGLSKNDRETIERLAGKETAEYIAAKLRRAPEQVARHLEEIGSKEVALKVGQNLSSGLEDRPEWAEFSLHYDEEELKFIKYLYVQLMNQFGRDDVLPTEEMQIFSLIHAEVMANQAMRERKTVVTQQKLVQAQLEAAYEKMAGLDPQSGEHKRLDAAIKELESRFTDASDKLKHINTRHASHQMQKNNLLGDLKATRDQRVKVVEGSKASFLGFLKALTNEDFRRDQGDQMEMMRIAMEKERVRISAEVEYVDGTVDRPLLTPETVMGDDDE